MTTRIGACVVALLLFVPAGRAASDEWIEMKSTHFTVVSGAGEGSTRTLLWQLEQVRSAMVTLWAWARVDLNKPLLVLAVRDENGLRALAPEYWETRGTVRPASLWVAGPDRHYLAIRADLDVDSQGFVNPHVTAYFSYISLVMGQSFSRDLPLWLSRGLAGVLSNTLIRREQIFVGAPIPWHLRTLQERPRTPLPKLLTITDGSPEFRRDEGMALFDAQAWAFVHFLMFNQQGAHAAKLNAFAKMVSDGTDAATAFRQSLGAPESFEADFRAYLDRPAYNAHRITADVSVQRERFPVRRLPTAEAAATRALFHVATRRPAEARTAIAAARKADPAAAGSYDAEALLLDGGENEEETKAALTRAVDAGSTNPYVHYRLASLTWRRDPDPATLARIDALLTRATALNTRFAAAYSWLGEIRALRGEGEPSGLVMRAVGLEPRQAVHRLRAAFVFSRSKKFEEAAVQARTALQLADSDDVRRRAEETLEIVTRARSEAADAPDRKPPR